MSTSGRRRGDSETCRHLGLKITLRLLGLGISAAGQQSEKGIQLLIAGRPWPYSYVRTYTPLARLAWRLPSPDVNPPPSAKQLDLVLGGAADIAPLQPRIGPTAAQIPANVGWLSRRQWNDVFTDVFPLFPLKETVHLPNM